MKRLILHDEVAIELEESAEFYERHREGYGEKVRSQVNKDFDFIRTQPKASSLYKNGPVRRRVTGKPFRYGVYYVELDESIYVLALMNQRRRPDYWMHRLDDAS